jgi:hypothetical protein
MWGGHRGHRIGLEATDTQGETTMAVVFKSKTTGEYGIVDNDGLFSWIDSDEARRWIYLARIGLEYYQDEGAPIGDDDPLWNDLLQMSP